MMAVLDKYCKGCDVQGILFKRCLNVEILFKFAKEKSYPALDIAVLKGKADVLNSVIEDIGWLEDYKQWKEVFKGCT